MRLDPLVDLQFDAFYSIDMLWQVLDVLLTNGVRTVGELALRTEAEVHGWTDDAAVLEELDRLVTGYGLRYGMTLTPDQQRQVEILRAAKFGADPEAGLQALREAGYQV